MRFGTRSGTSFAVRLARLVGLGLALLSAPALGLVIAFGDGRGNTAPPDRDPGWSRFGTKSPCPPQCGLTYLHLGQGWVLTAWHVTPQNVQLFASGEVYAHVPGSAVRVGGPGVDLLLFRIADAPALPLLPITRSTPAPGTPVLMVAGGQTRGDPLPGDPSRGWTYRLPSVLRWGTNRVIEHRPQLPPRFPDTRVFSTRFDWPGTPGATRYEAQAVLGDSGGAVFVAGEGRWELAGILVAANAPVYGLGVSMAADLSHYREEILAVVTRPPTAEPKAAPGSEAGAKAGASTGAGPVGGPGPEAE